MTYRPLPPEDLVIYEVRGTWDGRDRLDLGPDFLGFWVEADYSFFFFSQDPGKRFRAFLQDRANLEVRYVHRMKYAEWQDGAGFKPFSVGPLNIVPAWEDPPLGTGEFLVRIDPGLAFGFGGHPTTLACLQALVRVYEEDQPAQVLDLGAGTGVLALAAIRLGAARAWAVEYSHLAAETAQDNAALNGLDRVIEVIRGRAEDCLDFPAQLVCSNLHLQIQEDVFERGGFRGRGWLILSGMFHAQAERMEKALTGEGYRLVDRVRDERWTTLLLRAGPG